MPCPHCLGFFFHKDIWRHTKDKCAFSASKLSEASSLKMARDVLDTYIWGEGSFCSCFTLLITNNNFKHLFPGALASDAKVVQILSGMRHLEIAEAIRNDWLLLKYVKVLTEKYALMGNQENLIREKARLMTRLYLCIKEENPQVSDFADCFKCNHFDSLVLAVHSRTGKGEDIKTPSVALKIGHSLKKCCHILIGESMRNNDTQKKEEVRSFLELLENEWSEKVSKHCLETMANRKFNKPMSIPLTEDVVKLATSIKDEISQILKCKVTNEHKHRRLMELTLARIIIFNKKRSGEAAKMTVEQYETALVSQDKHNNNKELMSSLSEAEKVLAKKLLLVEIRGKRGRKVPVLLPPEAKQAMDVLLERR